MDVNFPASVVWDDLVTVLSERWTVPDFVMHYNNNAACYRCKNCRPRTDAILKDSASVLSELSNRLEARFRIEGTLERSRDRYIDFSLATGNWWEGTKRILFAAEVENNWRELRGTLSDLYRFQARTKMAIFYGTGSKALTELKDAAAEVAGWFSEYGLRESPDTQYLLVLLPTSNEISSEQHAMALEFTGLEKISSALERTIAMPLR